MSRYDASRLQHAIVPSFSKRWGVLAVIVRDTVFDHATVTDNFPFSNAKDVLSY